MADNLAAWLGLAHLSVFDVALLVPLLPLMVLAIIWWAPWEGWVMGKVPKPLISGYLFYCAFTFWHFHAPAWIVGLLGVLGLSAFAPIARGIYQRKTRWRRPES
jgi:hypothetical protein